MNKSKYPKGEYFENLWNGCIAQWITHSYMLTWYIAVQFRNLRVKENKEHLLISQKRVIRSIIGVHPWSPPEPLFITLKFLNCKYIFMRYYFLLHPLHPCWNIHAICETDKEPINPLGFPATFASMIIHCICNGIYSLCSYGYAVYYTLSDGTQ